MVQIRSVNSRLKIECHDSRCQRCPIEGAARMAVMVPLIVVAPINRKADHGRLREFRIEKRMAAYAALAMFN